jgi:hypothetical protein
MQTLPPKKKIGVGTIAVLLSVFGFIAAHSAPENNIKIMNLLGFASFSPGISQTIVQVVTFMLLLLAWYVGRKWNNDWAADSGMKFSRFYAGLYIVSIIIGVFRR